MENYKVVICELVSKLLSEGMENGCVPSAGKFYHILRVFQESNAIKLKQAALARQQGEENNKCKEALEVILDAIDYTAGNCRSNEMIGAVLDENIIRGARAAISLDSKTYITGKPIVNVKHGDTTPTVESAQPVPVTVGDSSNADWKAQKHRPTKGKGKGK